MSLVKEISNTTAHSKVSTEQLGEVCVAGGRTDGNRAKIISIKWNQNGDDMEVKSIEVIHPLKIVTFNEKGVLSASKPVSQPVTKLEEEYLRMLTVDLLQASLSDRAIQEAKALYCHPKNSSERSVVEKAIQLIKTPQLR